MTFMVIFVDPEVVSLKLCSDELWIVWIVNLFAKKKDKYYGETYFS